MQAVQMLQGPDSKVSPAERHELTFSEVVQLDAGLRRAIPAVMFHPPSRLRKLKAGFTYSYLRDNRIDQIAKSLRRQMREHLSE